MKLLDVHREFIEAIKNNQAAFGVNLDDSTTARLADYYELVLKHNPLLHLVAPCSHSEFATRHILESLALLEYLPLGARFADIGTGAGLPSIPCLIARDDLHAVLIESKEKKAKFLDEAIRNLGLDDKAEIINRQFEEAEIADCNFVTCRALDKFTDKLPRLLRWSGRRTKLLFGGQTLVGELQRLKLSYSESLIPLSERRFLFRIG